MGFKASTPIEVADMPEDAHPGEVKNELENIDAQTALSAARNRLVQARGDWYTARAEFERSIGRSLVTGAVSGNTDFGRDKEKGQ